MSTPDGVIAIDVVPGTVLSEADASSALEIDASAVRLKKVATDGLDGKSARRAAVPSSIARYQSLPPPSSLL